MKIANEVKVLLENEVPSKELAHKTLKDRGWHKIHDDAVHSIYVHKDYPGHFIRNGNRGIVTLTRDDGYHIQSDTSSHKQVNRLLDDFYKVVKK